MKKTVLLIIATFLFMHTGSYCSTADSLNSKQPNQFSFNLGFGAGMDYGGMGIRASFFPIKYVGAFGCFGYNFVGLGYNAGAIIRVLPDKRVCPYLTGMYGYNAVIYVKGAEKYNKIYYGPSVGLGIEFRSKKKNFFNLEIVLPFRPDSFSRDFKTVKNDPAINITSEPLPVAFSIGYHINFGNMEKPAKKRMEQEDDYFNE